MSEFRPRSAVRVASLEIDVLERRKRTPSIPAGA